jgi:hypothetical protein
MEGYTEAVELLLARLHAELKRTKDELAVTKDELARTRDALARQLDAPGVEQPELTAKAA